MQTCGKTAGVTLGGAAVIAAVVVMGVKIHRKKRASRSE